MILLPVTQCSPRKVPGPTPRQLHRLTIHHDNLKVEGREAVWIEQINPLRSCNATMHQFSTPEMCICFSITVCATMWLSGEVTTGLRCRDSKCLSPFREQSWGVTVRIRRGPSLRGTIRKQQVEGRRKHHTYGSSNEKDKRAQWVAPFPPPSLATNRGIHL